MKENRRLELTRLYNDIQDRLEILVSEYKIKPSEIKSYVENNKQELIEEFGYSDVDGIGRVLIDVAEHLSNSEIDGIMTFEAFVFSSRQ